MNGLEELADTMLDQRSEAASTYTGENPENVLDPTGRLALREYLASPSVVVDEDTAENSQGWPEAAELEEWALSLRAIRRRLDALHSSTASAGNGTRLFVRGLLLEQRDREAAFGRHMIGQLVDEEARA